MAIRPLKIDFKINLDLDKLKRDMQAASASIEKFAQDAIATAKLTRAALDSIRFQPQQFGGMIRIGEGFKDLRQQAQKMGDTVKIEQNQFDQLIRAFRGGVPVVESLAVSVDHLEDGFDELGDEIVDTGKKSRKYSDFLRSNMKDAAELNEKGIRALRSEYNSWSRAISFAASQLRTLAIPMKALITVGSEFEVTLSKISAVSGALPDEMSAIEQTARRLGASTAFSATESAEGLQLLVQTGFDVAQAIETIDDVLNLTGAGAFRSMATAAELTSQTLKIFQLDVSEAQRVTDVFAKSMNVSSLDAQRLVAAMSKAPPLFSEVGQSLEQTVSVLALFSNAGATGVRAGTALRSMMKSLINPSARGAEAIFSFGLSLSEIDPSKVEFSEIIKRLDDVGLASDENRAKLIQIFGSDYAVNIANAIKISQDAKIGIDSTLSALADSAGTAAEMYKIQMDNLTGDTAEFKSAMQELGISIFNDVSPALRDIVQIGTELIRTITGNVSLMQTFKGALSALANQLKTFGQFVKDNADTFSAWGQSIISVFRLVSDNVIVLGAMAAAFVVLKLSMIEALSASIALNASMILNPLVWVPLAIGALALLVKETIGFRQAWLEIQSSFQIVAGVVLVTFEKMQTAAQIMIEKLRSLGGIVQEVFSGIGSAINSLLTGDFSNIGNKIAEGFAGAGARVAQEIETVKQIQAASAKDIKSIWAGVGDTIQETFSSIENSAADATEEVDKTGEALGKLPADELAKIAAAAEAQAKKIGTLREQWEGFKESFTLSGELGEQRAKIQIDFESRVDNLADIFGAGTEAFQAEFLFLKDWREQQLAEIEQTELEVRIQAQIKFKEAAMENDSELWDLRIELLEINLKKEEDLTAAQIEKLRQVREQAQAQEFGKDIKSEFQDSSVLQETLDMEFATREQARLAELEAFSLFLSQKLELETLTEQQRVELSKQSSKTREEMVKIEEKRQKDAAFATIGTLGQLMAAFKGKSRALFAFGKAAAISSAIVNTIEGVTKTIAKYPFPLSAVMASAQAALGFAQVAQIKSQSFASGVIGLQGAGTETSDSIPARLSKGESVMTASETRDTKPILQYIRNVSRPVAQNLTQLVIDSGILATARRGAASVPAIRTETIQSIRESIPRFQNGVVDFLNPIGPADFAFSLPQSPAPVGQGVSVSGIESRLDRLNRTVASNRSQFTQILNSIDVREVGQDAVLDAIRDFSDRGIIEGVTINA